jgi:hypothetical protein
MQGFLEYYLLNQLLSKKYLKSNQFPINRGLHKTTKKIPNLHIATPLDEYRL